MTDTTLQEPRGHTPETMAALPQFTASQIMEAARRAEAASEVDRALQLYRHIVEHHAAALETYEARDGVMRLMALQRAVRDGGHGAHAATAARLPLVVQPRPGTPPPDMPVEPEFTFRERYRAGTLIAQAAHFAGWLLVGAGTSLGTVVATGLGGALAAPSLFDLPAGIVYGLAAAGCGLALVLTSQLALAVFDNANASRHLLAIERAKAEL